MASKVGERLHVKSVLKELNLKDEQLLAVKQLIKGNDVLASFPRDLEKAEFIKHLPLLKMSNQNTAHWC